MNKSYKFVVSITNAKILDWSTISDDLLEEILRRCKALEEFKSLLIQYPTTDRARILKSAWNEIRNSMILRDGGGSAKWNRIFRDLGYDALFDDTGSIHNAEVQLLIFNPKVISKISRFSTSMSGWKEIQKVIADVKVLCAPYGTVTVEGPTKMKSSSLSIDPPLLTAKVNIVQNIDNYADLLIQYDHTDRYRRLISISLRWSRPSLNYGVGADYDIHKKEYDKYADLDRLKLSLDRIFADDP